MALIDNTVYTGKDAEGFYSKALLSGPSKSLLTLIPNVKSKIKLADFNLGNILQDADCTFSSDGEGVLEQKSFEVCPIKINLEYCQRTFETNYLSEQLRAGSNGAEVISQSMSDYLLDITARKTSADLEKIVWQGNTGTGSTYPLNVCDGLLKKMDDANDVIEVTGSTISPSTVIAALTAVYNAIPNEVFTSKDDVKIFAPIQVTKAYKAAVATQSNEVYFVGDKTLNFLGIEIVEAPGMPNNNIVAGSLSNMFLFTDLESDFEDIQILNMKTTLGQPTVRLVGEFKFGVDFYYGSEIVRFKA
jgi:hypothetical protein